MFFINTKLLWSVNILFALLFAAASIFIFKGRKDDAPEPELAELSEGSDIQKELLEDINWALFLINADNPLPENYNVALAPINDYHQMDERAAAYAVKMIEEAETDGIKLNVISSYRDFRKQGDNFDNYVKRLIEEGYSREEAFALTAAQIQHPGASEHNAGLALDIVTIDWWDTHNDITPDFEETEEFAWLRRNSWQYGFVMRYPKGKEEITGIDYEPWHFRYVGVFYAEQIYYSGLCLEEYMEVIS